MGQIIATTISASTALFLSIFIGIPLVSVPFVMASDFWDGLTGQPAEMNYRPGFQNIGLGCGEGGSCD